MPISRRLRAEAAAFGLAGGALTLILIGVPTALIRTPWFGREIPPRPLDWIILALTAALAAGLAATYAFSVACPARERTVTAGGMLAFFAVGCPVCNKLVVLLLGWGGALTYFAPLQPFLGVVSLGLLGFALAVRLRAIRHGLRAVGEGADRPASGRPGVPLAS